MKDFAFHRPKTIEEAVALLREKDGGKLLAGGQSLLPVLKLELAEPSDLISLAAVEGLREIGPTRNGVRIGALVTHDEVARSELVREQVPALATLASQIGDPQVRNRGTLGGSVAHADPAADYPAALVALDAVVHTDRRTIAAGEFFTGLFESALERDELVVSVNFPRPRRAAYAKFAHRASKYALVGVMVAETFNGDIRVAVTGAGAKVFRVPEMETALARTFTAAAIEKIQVSADDLNGDGEASAEYRAHLVNVMARRAVQAASA